MKGRRFATILVLIITIPLLMTPAAAYYFDLQGFETDKLVYEVGETVNMAADLIADFGSGGWCRLTFGFVADQGPVFAEEYNITPSTELRQFAAFYVIHPDDTSPGALGSQGFAIFNAEIYDTVSESDGRNIEITITRGHLTVVPVSSLVIAHGAGAILLLKVASIHNSDITRSSGDVLIQIHNEESEEVLFQNTTIDSDGLISLPWNDTIAPPGLYTLTVTAEPTEDFLSLNESLVVSVLPAVSNLTVLTAPSSAACRSPDGTHFETIRAEVQHTNSSGSPLEGSAVYWSTTFGSGVMTDDGNGVYSSWIPILFAPGSHNISISANHSGYQECSILMLIEALPNTLTVIPQASSLNVTQGESFGIQIAVTEQYTWNQSVNLEFHDSLGEVFFEDTLHLGEQETLQHTLGPTVSVGPHTLTASVDSEYYRVAGVTNLTLIVLGTIDAHVSIGPVFYGEEFEFNLTAIDSASNLIQVVRVSIHVDDESAPIFTATLADSTRPVTVLLPTRVGLGPHNLTIGIDGQYYEHTATREGFVVWMRTNITIIIDEVLRISGSVAPDDPHDFVWLNHETAANLVEGHDISIIINNSGDFPDELAKVQFRHDYLSHSPSEVGNGTIGERPESPEAKRPHILGILAKDQLLHRP
jgi:hypothetical protein